MRFDPSYPVCINGLRLARPMSYRYFHIRADQHRDVAHWRGAKGGMRVLSLPSCQGWLRRQANDASYDFWPDLSIGTGLMRERRSSVRPPAVQTHAVFIMHKDHGGDWDIARWQADQAGEVRPLAANGEHEGEDGGAMVTPMPKQRREAHAGMEQENAATSFIIEIGGAKRY